MASLASETELESGGPDATEAKLTLGAGLSFLGALGWVELDMKKRVSERARGLDMMKTGESTLTCGAPGSLLSTPDPSTTSGCSCQEKAGLDARGPGNKKSLGLESLSEGTNGLHTFQISGIISAETARGAASAKIA